MGMAASQARLLSITSRMSDNELRAQLINNAKMRLTDDTAKASEKYLNALNKTELMMSNKDTMGNEMYQQLTFNNLTAYSSYNNQYGLINKAGELVVSELDAAKYVNALKEAEKDPNTTALEEYLKQYGIEKDSTSYWESNNLSNDLRTRYEGDIEYDDNANRISGLHYGYELSKTSTEVMVYERLLSEYQVADTAYTNAVIKYMKEYLYGYIPSGETMEYQDKYEEVMTYNTQNGITPTVSQSEQSLNYLRKMFSELVGGGKIKSGTGFTDVMDYYLNKQIQFQNGSASMASPTNIVKTANGYSINNGAFEITQDSNGNYQVKATGDYSATSGITASQNGGYSFTYTKTETDPDGNKTVTPGTCNFNLTDPISATLTTQLGPEQLGEVVKNIYKYFQQGVLNEMDRTKFAQYAPNEKKAYEEAAEQLSMFIFGQKVDSKYYDKLDDMEWVLYESNLETTNLDGNTMIYLDQTENGQIVTKEYKANFEAIKDIYLIEEMIDMYGAPKYTWIDKNNPNENADAKAQWYTNMFEKMQESGYQKITLDLTKSTDWIQFALESGLLTMVQVDDENQWISTMYSNCSDITEDTIELEITRAEAEYTKETKKIQAKDQRYDLELKNIDTEHESLQTEYDSIKSVIDKNVERNFKMFG